MFETICVVPAAIITLGIIAYMTALSSEPISAQEEATPTGELVVAPQSVELGQTTLAVGFHVEPADLEVKIEYSGHFIPEGESCDDAGTSRTTQSAVAPTWIRPSMTETVPRSQCLKALPEISAIPFRLPTTTTTPWPTPSEERTPPASASMLPTAN